MEQKANNLQYTVEDDETNRKQPWSTPTITRLSANATEGKSTAFPTETTHTLGPGS
jgi:hypothetical protein